MTVGDREARQYARLRRKQNVDRHSNSHEEHVLSTENSRKEEDAKTKHRRTPSSDNGASHSREKRSHSKKRSGRRSKSFLSGKSIIFVIGTIAGLLFAHYMAKHNTTVDLAGASQEWLLGHKNMLPDTLVELLEQSQENDHENQLSDDFAVGLNMHQEGFRPKHPVIMVPGVVSSSLENWGLHGTEECPSKPHYRKQMWGGFYMIKQMLLSKSCWLQHIMLDKETGLDPGPYKIRAAQGIESADYFITGYWIWNKIIENLSAMGYDPDNMDLASYDWRLSYADLEKRDAYFSHLKATCEVNLKHTGLKTSIIAHSMGSEVIFYFFKWVEAMGPGFGNGGPHWVNDHVAHFVDVSGSLLGTPKALVALLSGEMRDTVSLNPLAAQALEKFFGRDERVEMLRTWPGIASMLPKGGHVIWGNTTNAPDDPANTTESFGNFIRFVETETPMSSRNLTLEQALDLVFEESPQWFNRKTLESYSFGLARTREEVVVNEKDPSKWSNPLEVALPNAPDLEIYSFYGVGKSTERAYYYRDSAKDPSTSLNLVIDYESLERGSVVTGPGDGTISLPCHAISHRWKERNSKFNPGGAKVKIVEMLHRPDIFDLRGGTQTADHVDILGRTELNELLLRIVGGHGDKIEERIVSNINDWVWELDLGEN